MSVLLQISVLVGLFAEIFCGRILLLSHQFGSHMMVCHALGAELPKMGHEVYAVLGSDVKEPSAVKENGYEVIRFYRPANDPLLDMSAIVQKHVSYLFKGEKDFTLINKYAFYECQLLMEDKQFIQQVKELKFDLVVVTYLMVGHCLDMLPYSLGIPFVVVGPIIQEFIMRTPQPASFVPNILMQTSEHMDFFERLKAFLINSAMAFPSLSPFVVMKNTTMLNRYVNDPEIQHWNDLARQASLFFICAGSLVEPATPLMPNVINVEGLTATPSIPLNKEFENLASSAVHGIVVVSFGSGIRNLPQNAIQKMLDAFGQRKELFLWRIQLNQELGFTVPTNVLVYKWLPQNDLLGHQKARLFITHSGNNGRYEAIYHGVPMIAFPIFGDQPHNAAMLALKGYGIVMHMPTFSVPELLENMGKILDSSYYTDRIRKASKILKSLPSGRETAAFWVDHILQFGSAHLKNDAAMSMPYYQFAMWDIYGFIMAIILCMIMILIYILKYINNLFIRNSSKDKNV